MFKYRIVKVNEDDAFFGWDRYPIKGRVIECENEAVMNRDKTGMKCAGRVDERVMIFYSLELEAV
jgi:hypothetical protein